MVVIVTEEAVITREDIKILRFIKKHLKEVV